MYLLKPNLILVKLLLVGAATIFLVNGMLDLTRAQSSSSEERKFKNKKFSAAPVRVRKVKNLQSDTWHHDLEIEVENVSTKPIYFINAVLEFPDDDQTPGLFKKTTQRPQQTQVAGHNQTILIDNNRPTVYMTFERQGKREPLHARESTQGVWLRLHNNTRWAINLCTPSLYIPPKVAPTRLVDGRNVLALREGAEVSICHGIEERRPYDWNLAPKGDQPKNTRLINYSNLQLGYDTGDVFSSAWLPPGRSLVFSLPREHLSRDHAVFVRYNFEWEYGERTFKRNESEHRVYFRSSDLPRKK